MTTPTEEIPPARADEEEARGWSNEHPMPWVWLLVAAVIGLVCYTALSLIISPPDVKGDQLRIHRALIKAEADVGIELGNPKGEGLRAAIAGLEQIETKDKAAAGTLARALLVLRQAAEPAAQPDFSGLTDAHGDSDDALTPKADSSKDIAKVNQALRSIYSEDTLSRQQIEAHAKSLGDLGARWPLSLAVQHADKSNGIAGMSLEDQAMFGVIMMSVLLVGVACLILLAVIPAENAIPLTGTPATGDNLGARFLLFMFVFSIAGTAISSLFEDPMLGSAFALAAIIVITVLLLNLPIKGKAFSAREIGLRSSHLGKDILFGVMGFFANFPPALLLIVFGLNYMRWIPSGGHPIQTEILAGGNLPLILLTAGPLTAVMEELAFRGILFQGLALRFRVWPAIVLSALGFAMIHPQGGALWLSLAWIGGMGACLTYKRRSLVPAIVMHALHNSAIILLATFLS